MPSFKPKTDKKKTLCNKFALTLDSKHNEYVAEFLKNECEHIPHLKKIKKELKRQLKTQTQMSSNNQPMSIDEIMETKDKINEINAQIKELIEKKKNYYLNNSVHIFEYFESKQNINNGEKDNKPITTKTQMVYNFFKIKMNDTKGTNKNTQDIVNKYLCNTDNTFLDMSLYVRETDICQHCHKGELIPLDDEGIILCNSCAVSVPYLIENEKPSYKEPPKEICYNAYQKFNHWKEILSQWQGKESTTIPDTIIERIKQQIKKERIGKEQLCYEKMKEILKKLELNKYYEHISYIKNKLGIKPPCLSPEMEETMNNLFMQILHPYSKYCPNERVNFLHYYYVLYKFCELLGEPQYLSQIPLLKDDDKIIEQDQIWKHICVDLDWKYIPTV